MINTVDDLVLLLIVGAGVGSVLMFLLYHAIRFIGLAFSRGYHRGKREFVFDMLNENCLPEESVTTTKESEKV